VRRLSFDGPPGGWAEAPGGISIRSMASVAHAADSGPASPRRTFVSRIRRIIHATDFSHASRAAFSKAVDLAKTPRAELLVLHVLSGVPPFLGEGSIAPQMWNDIEAGARAGAKRQLKRLVARARRAGVHVKSLVVLGSPYEQIVRAAQRQRADPW
jgi:universal stress protein E